MSTEKKFRVDNGIETPTVVVTGSIEVGGYASPAPSINGFSSIIFADGSTQTTAYETAQQYGYLAMMNNPGDNNRVDGEAVVVDSGGNTYISYSYYDDNSGNNYGGIAKFSSTGTKLWSQNVIPDNTDANYPQIASLELSDIGGNLTLVLIGSYYDNNTGNDKAFMYLADPVTGNVGSIFDFEANVNGGMRLSDGVFGMDGNSQPYAAIVGTTYSEALVKTLTPIAPSTTNKLYISWSDFNNSGLTAGSQLYYNTGGSYGAYLNQADAEASPDGASAGIGLKIASTGSNGSYAIIGVNGWSGAIYGWSDPVNLRILGSNLGGVDGVNDFTFDFSVSTFNNNSNNIQAATSNLAGLSIAEVYCPAWNGKDWSTDIGTPLNFDYYLNGQAYVARLGTSTWMKSLGVGNNYENFNSVVVDSSENIYVVGRYQSNTGHSGIVAKYNNSGTQQWAVYVDPSDELGIELYSVDLLADGDLICVGDEGIVTKLSASDGSIIWQTRIDSNNDLYWDSDFKGTATPSGDYIFANYEDDNYKMYAIKLSGTDGTVTYTKEISRYYQGENGEIYPQDDFDAQYIDCNDTTFTIAATTYIYLGDSIYNGLVINLPVDGENADGTYGQFTISSYSMPYVQPSTTSTSATLTTETTGVTTGSESATSSDYAMVVDLTTIGGGAPVVPPTSIENGTSNVAIADADGNIVISVNNDNMHWTFATDGNIYGKQDYNFNTIAVDNGSSPYIYNRVQNTNGNDYSRTDLSRYGFNINLDQQGTGYQWQFNNANLYVPQNGNSYIQNYYRSVIVSSMAAGNNDAKASLQSLSNNSDPNVFTSIDATTTGANIVTYNGGSNGGTANTWTFDNVGNLTVPGPIRGPNGGNLVLKGGKAGPAGQFAVSNGASLGYGGNLAIFRQSDFTSGLLSDIQVGNVVVENNGATANVTTVTPNLAGAGTVGIYLDNYWNQVPPYTWYAGYGPDGNVTIHAGTANYLFNSSTTVCPLSTYANLPTASTAGQRAFISDANLVAVGNFGNTVSGSGSNTVPVYSDGTNWRIG